MPQIAIEEKARTHATFCARCAWVLIRYRARVHRPWSTVPTAVASEIRAQLCPEGQRILDELLGVPHMTAAEKALPTLVPPSNGRHY